MSSKVIKDYKGMAMEGLIATWYAKNTGKNIQDYKADARRVAENLPAGSAVLEVAPGPGYLSIELAKLGNSRITGLEISQTFVEIAQANARAAGVQIDFRLGSALRMSFDDGKFDFIVCRAAFKNFADPVVALDEMYRVLKPGGKGVIIDLRADASDADINACVDNMGLDRLNTLFTKWIFKFSLLKRAYTKASLTELVSRSRFKDCDIHESLIGVDVWLERIA
jgi:ubiquinone/menaquinone biosynthesis C-methylase UbiE